MGNRTNYGTGRMTVDNRQKNERSRSGNPYSSHVKAGKHAGTVYNFKRKSRIRKSLTRLPILLEFIHKYIFLNFVSFYNGLNSNLKYSAMLISRSVEMKQMSFSILLTACWVVFITAPRASCDMLWLLRSSRIRFSVIMATSFLIIILHNYWELSHNYTM